MDNTPFRNLSILANGRTPEQLVKTLPREINDFIDSIDPDDYPDIPMEKILRRVQLYTSVIAECRILLHGPSWCYLEVELPEHLQSIDFKQLQKIGNLCLGAITQLEDLATGAAY